MTDNSSSPTFPRDLAIDIRLDDDPRYKGSIHEDAVAKARGYKAALIPGAFVYGHVSRVALQAWGEAWMARGGMGIDFRRPVYNGDRIVMRAGALGGNADMRRADVSVVNEEDEEVAKGWIGLPDAPPARPDISGLSIIPRPETPPVVKVGELHPGMPLTTADRVLSEADFRASLKAFDETERFYADKAIIHSGCLMRLAMGDTHNSFSFPSPMVLTATEAQHFGLVRPGERLAVVGSVAGAYERKGKHYLQSEEFLLADRRLVARFLRTQIYGYDTPVA